MSQQIQITGGAKVRNLEGVLTGTSGVVNALGINVPSGIPQLDGSGKILVSQLPNSVMEYKGTWNAATNTPTLADGTGNQGDVYLCNVAGTVNFGSGPIAFFVGDQVIYSGTIWQRASGATGTVTSVAVTESGDALTITGSPITTSGTINIGFNGSNLQYINGAGDLTTFPSLSGFVPYTGATANLDLGTFDLTADVITGATGSFASSGGSDTFAINHSSGSGIALNITKGGNGEGLYINKTSGSGNAATIVGNLGGTSATFSSTLGVTGALNGTSATFSNNISVSGVTIGKGRQAGTGTSNIGIGFAALAANTTGINNLAIGSGTLYNNTTGDNNISLGYNTLEYNTTGGSNIALGLNTLGDNTTGNNNIGIGIQALEKSTTADGNIGIGYGALGLNTTGVYNTAIGYIAGSAITTGSYNTIVGRYVGTTTMDNNIILADGAGNIRYQWNGTNNVFGNPISGTSATFSSRVNINGASDDADIAMQIKAPSGVGKYIMFGRDASNVAKFSLSAEGAGGFSSSVTANSYIRTLDRFYAGDGTQADPSIRFWNSATGLYAPASETLGFVTNTTEKMRITSGGNVGIGVTPSNWNVIKPIEIGGAGNFFAGFQGGSALYLGTAAYYQSGWKYAITGTAGSFLDMGSGNFIFQNAASGTAGNNLTWTERMRITSGGQVNINSTQTTYPFYVQAAINTWTAVMENTTSGSNGLLIRQTGGSAGIYFGAYDGGAYKFFVNGSGVVNSTSTSITIISSDQKLKTDIRDYDKGLAEVLAMKPRIYKRKNNLAVDEVGFIAQEMDIALAGSMIESYKDEDGEPIHTYQLEWYPLLVKAIQELNQKGQEQQAQIEELSNKIVALESK